MSKSRFSCQQNSVIVVQKGKSSAAMAEDNGGQPDNEEETSKHSPESLYQICLSAFVRNLCTSKSFQSRQLRAIRFLPPFVIIDIFHSMAEDEAAHGIFCAQLEDIRLMGKLLNFGPGRSRQKLFKCLAMVIAANDCTHKICVNGVADAFVAYVNERYEFVGRHVKKRSPAHIDRSARVMNGQVHNYKPGAMLRRLSYQRRRQMGYLFFHDEDLIRAESDRHSNDPDEEEEEEEGDDEEGLGATGNRDYFYYGIDSIHKSKKAEALENWEQQRKQQRNMNVDLKASDLVWNSVFKDGQAMVDKRNGIGQAAVPDEREDYENLDKLFDANEIIYLIRQEPYMRTIHIGLQIGSFLAEAGWVEDAIVVYQETSYMIQCLDDLHAEHFLLNLDCLQRILNAQSRFCLFNEAHKTSHRINCLVKQAMDRGQQLPACLLARICKERSMMHFVRSEYDMSFNWSVRALQLLHQGSVSERVSIEVLLQAGKSCVVKRQYKRANMLITMAVARTLALYGKSHQRYADALLDYGFYLLNVDLIVNSVNVYTDALEIKEAIFGELNLNVGTAHEDLAYALYVKEYSSGEFVPAKDHIDKAINIMNSLVPWNHLMLASAKRVKALILEEIALDQGYGPLLEQSEKLHESALRLSLDAFGEINVQTAKHYGNLGRLYQSMMRFGEAEQMHKRAIKIKTDLLGAYDYEVGLSIGHLASLYNYQMSKHKEAEELYKKSIEISLRLFGESYSGLEYDYRGLCHIYELLHNTDKYIEYSRILDHWRNLRMKNEEVEQLMAATEEELDNDSSSVEEVIAKFFDANPETGLTTACSSSGSPAQANLGSSVS